MIKACLHNGTISVSWRLLWRQIPNGVKLLDVKFGTFYYKINETMYLRDSEEFREAFQKERMWEKLNDGI